MRPPETVSDGGLSDSPENLWKPAVIGWGIPAGWCHLAGEYPRESRGWVGNADAGPGVPVSHPDPTAPLDR